MKKCPYDYLKNKIGFCETNTLSEDNGVKQKTENILDYLSAKDLSTINSENQEVTVESFQQFIGSTKNLEKERRIEAINDHVTENLYEYTKLKASLNNLHIKMFWESFKKQIESLGDHDFFGIKDGKLVAVAFNDYAGSLFRIERVSNKEGREIKFKKMPKYSDLLSRIIPVNFFTRKLGMFSKLDTYNDIYNAGIRIDLFQENYIENIIFLYDIFCENHKDNEIIKYYLALESIISENIQYHSNFKHIAPNTNRRNLDEYLHYRLTVEGKTRGNCQRLRNFLGSKTRKISRIH